MTYTAASYVPLAPANDDCRYGNAVPAQAAQRTRERRLMLSSALLAGSLLFATMVHGYIVLQPLSDMVTFAFRV